MIDGIVNFLSEYENIYIYKGSVVFDSDQELDSVLKVRQQYLDTIRAALEKCEAFASLGPEASKVFAASLSQAPFIDSFDGEFLSGSYAAALFLMRGDSDNLFSFDDALECIRGANSIRDPWFVRVIKGTEVVEGIQSGPVSEVLTAYSRARRRIDFLIYDVAD